MTAEEYFYYEWLTIGKKMKSEQYSLLDEKEKYNLFCEYKEFQNKTK